MRCAVFVTLCVLLLLGARVASGAEKEPVKPVAEAPRAFVTVAGAPGDGERALSAALTKRLSAIGVTPASAFAADVYSVEGIVWVAPAKGGRQSVRIDWKVFGPDGNTLGGVSQTKFVRKGSLDRKWGGTADAAARAAAREIAALLPH